MDQLVTLQDKRIESGCIERGKKTEGVKDVKAWRKWSDRKAKLQKTLNPSDIKCSTSGVKGKGMRVGGLRNISEEARFTFHRPISPNQCPENILPRRYISQPPMRILCRKQ
jgi:hypothetical protein